MKTRWSMCFAALACGGSSPPPPEVKPPVRAECALAGGWAFEQPRELRIRAGGPVFATVGEVERAELSLGATAHVELQADVLRLGGFVPVDRVILHAARPMLVAGALIPGPRATIRWLGGEESRARIEVVLPEHIVPLVPQRVEWTCADLTLERGSFEARDAIAEEGEEVQAMLPGGQAVPVSTTPGGPPVVELRYLTDDGPLVDVVERRGDQVRVVVLVHSLDPQADVLVVGWVPAELLRPHDRGFGGSWAEDGGFGRRRGRPRPGARRVSCEHEVPLTVELHRDRRLVGAVKPRVVIEVLAGPSQDMVEVVLLESPVELADGARFLTRRDRVEACPAAGQ